MNNPQEVYGNVSALYSLLDRIDSKKVSRTSNAGDVALSRTAASAAKPAEIKPTAPLVVLWHEFIDPSSGKSYYHNYETQETSWEKPTTFTSAIQLAPVVPNPVLSNFEVARSSSSADDYRAIGFFNAKDGRYTGQSSRHFTQDGRPIDKATRQLSAFVDMTELEQNREETKRKKAEVTRAMRGTDWKEYRKEKSDEKKRKRLQWMLED